MCNRALSSSESPALKYPQQNPSGFIYTIWRGIMYCQPMATRGREVTVLWDPLSVTSKWQVRYWHTSPSFWGLDARETVSYKSPWEDADVARAAGRGEGSPGAGKGWKTGGILPLFAVRLGGLSREVSGPCRSPIPHPLYSQGVAAQWLSKQRGTPFRDPFPNKEDPWLVKFWTIRKKRSVSLWSTGKDIKFKS